MENRRLSRVILSVGSVHKNTCPDVKMLSAGTRVLWARWQFGAERLWIYQTPPPPYPAAHRAMAVSDPSFSPKGVPPNPLPWDPESAPQYYSEPLGPPSQNDINIDPQKILQKIV